MDTTQLLLTIVLTISTIFAIIIGVQLILVLNDLRRVIKKANGIISGFESMGLGLEHGLSEITGFLGGFRSIMKIIDNLTHKYDEKKLKPAD